MKIYCNSANSNIREYAEQFVVTGLWLKLKNVYHPFGSCYYVRFIDLGDDDTMATVNFLDTEDFNFEADIDDKSMAYYEWLVSRELHLPWRDIELWYDVCTPVEAYTDDDMFDLITNK